MEETSLNEILTAMAARLVELEQQVIRLQKAHVSIVGELRQKHERDQAAFNRIGDSLERLALERGGNPSGPVN